jgi:catechol 2,3-dioxygenase-like lactoylglutathione lyase family enzyme
MSTTPTQISQIQLVMIPSTDQDRSVAFYEALGFEKRTDIPWGDGYRWVEIYLPSSATGIVLVPPGPGERTGVPTGMLLDTDDIDAAHGHLRSIGVDVDAEVARVGAPAEIRIGPRRARRSGAAHVLVPRSRWQHDGDRPAGLTDR